MQEIMQDMMLLNIKNVIKVINPKYVINVINPTLYYSQTNYNKYRHDINDYMSERLDESNIKNLIL